MGAPAAFKVEEWKHMIREELIVVDSLKQKFEKLIQGQGVSAEFHVSDYSSSVGENVCKAAKVKFFNNYQLQFGSFERFLL